MTGKLERIQKLIPMLSSGNDGEVVAAARALGRALVNEGFDYHDLAKVASELFAETVQDEVPDSEFDDLKTPLSLIEILFDRYGDEIGEWEEQFLKGIRKRLKRRVALTEKQLSKLSEIFEQATA